MVLSLFGLHRRILALVTIFLLFGEVMLFSATGVMALEKYGSEFYYVVRQGCVAIVGFGLMLILSKIRYQFWRKITYPLLTLQFSLLLATLFTHYGREIQGSSRWLSFAGFTFQPSELAKVTLVLYVARLLSQFEQIKVTPKVWFTHGAVILTLLALVFKSPDLGSTLLLVTTLLILFFIAGARLTYVGGFLASGVAFGLFAMLHSDYRRRRLMAFLNPWADPQGNGFQAIQSFLSFHSGQLFGVGIGNGNSKLFYLPEVHTDFIFALVGEELGFIGTITLLLLFVYFGYLLLKASLNAPDSFGRFLGVGLSTSILLQIAANLGGVTGIIPLKGLPLPFISWGRSALLVNLFMVGILLNIVRQSGIIAAHEGNDYNPEKNHAPFPPTQKVHAK